MVELVKAFGSDGKEYAVSTLNWSLAKIEDYWAKISRFPIFSDDLSKTPESFLQFVLTSSGLWFEITDIETNEVVGLMYLTDIMTSSTGRMLEATWHAMVWDAKAGPRRPVFRAAVKALFSQFGFHRLRAEIPLHFGGVIRQAKKIGFKEEGRLREAKQYGGIWFDALMLSILDKEAAQWEV